MPIASGVISIRTLTSTIHDRRTRDVDWPTLRRAHLMPAYPKSLFALQLIDVPVRRFKPSRQQHYSRTGRKFQDERCWRNASAVSYTHLTLPTKRIV